MKTIGKAILSSLAILVATGCAVDTDTGSPETSDKALQEAPETKPLATVKTPTGTVEFLDLTSEDGVPRVAISETSRISAGMTPLQTHLAAKTSTSLETFMALSEETPPALLVDAHALEAKELGRADDAIVPAEIDVNAFVEKLSAATCSAWLEDFIDSNEPYSAIIKAAWLTEDNITVNRTSSTVDMHPHTWMYGALCNDSTGTTPITSTYYANSPGFAQKTLYTSSLLRPGFINRIYFNWRFSNNTQNRTTYSVRTYNANGFGTVRYHRRIWSAYELIR